MALPFTISCYLAFHLICLYLSSKYVFGYVMSPHPSLRCDHLKGRSGLQGYIVPNNCSNLFYSCWNDEVQGPYFCREDQVFNLEVEICEQNGCYGHAPSLALRNNKNKKAWGLHGYGSLENSKLTDQELQLIKKRCLPDNQQPGNSQMTQRIMGGTVVDTNKVAVWLQFDYVTGGWYGNSKEKTVCTGFFVSQKHVLTVRHCIETYNEEESQKRKIKENGMSLEVGGTITGPWHNLPPRNNMKKVEIESIYYPIDAGLKNDWAVVTTLQAKEVDFLCLGDRHIPDTILAEGWGYQDLKGKKTSRELRQIKLKTTLGNQSIKDLEMCRKVNFFCAISMSVKNPTRVREGDSGGPGFQTENGKPTVYGIILNYSDRTENNDGQAQEPYSGFLMISSIRKELCNKFNICY